MVIQRRRTLLGGAALLVLGILLSFLVIGGSPPAKAETGQKALILDSSVSGGASSAEATNAVGNGFTVTVVDDATWAGMTAAQFADYQLIVVGDPTCDLLPEVVSQNATALADAVMARSGGNTKAGNRVLIGTDPVYHIDQGGNRLIETAIDFAGVQDGATNLYLDFTCFDEDYNGNTIPDGQEKLLPLLTIAVPTWSQNQAPPCGGDVSLISNAAQFSTLTSNDLRGWECSVHETFPTFPTDWSALAIATDTATAPTCGTDVDTGAARCGEAYVLIAGSGIVTEAPNLKLDPPSDENPVNTSHTITATVTNTDDTPRSGVLVSFIVTGANSGASGVCVPADCTSNSEGKVTFTYTGTAEGDDTINAAITVDGSRQTATAAKKWIVSPSEPINAEGTDVSAVEGASFSGEVATFTAATASTASDFSATIDWGDGSPTSAGTISGSGGSYTVDGTHTYIDHGSYPITVVITETSNTSNTDTATSTATVADAPLTSECAAASTSLRVFAGPTARFTDANPYATSADHSATIDWGDSSSSAGVVSPGTGSGPYTVSGTHTYSSTGPFTITTTITDVGGSQTVATCQTLTYAFAPGGGSFVIGDKNSAIGTNVTFWGAQWWKLNSLSGGASPAAFKGFAKKPTSPSCGTGWSTDPGNSAPPPNGPLPAYMGVLVTSKTTKSGSQISGNTVHIVVVQTNSGYRPNPGNAGTGKVVAQVC